MRGRIAKGMLRLFALMPLPLNHAVGAMLGRLAWRFGGAPKDATETNLALCFPQLNASEREAMARRCLVETGRSLSETGPLWLWGRERLLRLVRQVHGEGVLADAMAAGRGTILALPHTGAWELFGVWCPPRYATTSLYRPARIRELDKIIRAARERHGNRLVAAGARGVKALYQALARGELVIILPDQDPEQGAGMFAPFFGVPANTMVLLSRLAMKTGAAVVFGRAQRLPRGGGYELHFTAGDASIASGPLEASVTAVNAAVEQCVRACPEQYQWSYKRFKTRPPGAPWLYDGLYFQALARGEDPLDTGVPVRRQEPRPSDE
jgi:KDO2-lipid IV(A) lauroyltransferase